MGHCDQDHDLACLGQLLVILTESPVTIEPAKCPLDDPALWLHLEGGLPDDATDDLQDPAERQHPRRERLATVASVGKQRHEPGEPTAQVARHQSGTSPVRDIGSRDDDHEQQPECIDG